MAKIMVRQARALMGNGSVLAVPYWVIDSGVDGPTLLALACQHGNEVNGCESVRLFAETMARNLRRGGVFAVPFANPPAMRRHRPHLDLGPEQPYIESRGHNMQTVWPGRPDGNDTERVAAALWEAVVKPATHVIDIHCYPLSAAALLQYRMHSPENEILARVMAFPFMRRIPAGDVGDWPGALGNQAGLAGKVAVGVELKGQYTVVEGEVFRGFRGLSNVAKHLGMMAGDPEGMDEPSFLLGDPPAPVTVQAKQPGLFVGTGLKPCDYVSEGQVLGHLLCDMTLDHVPVAAPVAGYLLRSGVNRPNCDVSLAEQHAFVFDGDTLAVILPRSFQGTMGIAGKGMSMRTKNGMLADVPASPRLRRAG